MKMTTKKGFLSGWGNGGGYLFWGKKYINLCGFLKLKTGLLEKVFPLSNRRKNSENTTG